MELIDTHTHLYDLKFSDDLEATVQRAIESGVAKVILPAIDSSYHLAMEGVLANYPNFTLRASGLHPTSVADNWQEELRFALDRLYERDSIAVGEIGIDLYWSDQFIEEQKRVLEEQIAAALELNLPLIIHSRNSFEEIFSTLKKFNQAKLHGVFHAFSGSYETYNRIKSLGNFKIGIGGVVTFKNSKLATTVSRVGLDNIVLETDSPWLAPTPYRGKRNEPSYIVEVATVLAQLFELPLEEIAKITTENAKTLFNLNSH